MAVSHKERVRKRTIWLFVLVSVMYVALVGRLIYVQVCDSEQYRGWASRIRFRDIKIPACRGSIYDRAGRVLALSIESTSVYANRNEVRDPDETAIRVAALLGTERVDLDGAFAKGRTIVWLGRKVDPRRTDQLSDPAFRLPGVGVQRDEKRVYPAGTLAANILGFTNTDNAGIEGQERILDKLLRGRDGLMRAELDARRRVIAETRHTVFQPENGRDVYLTIDTTIQHVAEQALAKMAEQFHPEQACAIVLDPRTGEILALANYPSYDPNNPRTSNPKCWRNRAVADLYEPGSTLKVLTIAAGLNEGLPANGVYANCTGREKISGGSVPCSLHSPYLNGHGAVTMPMIIRHSCNIGAAHIALRLGSEKLRSYAKAFGMLDRCDAGFGCEAVGYLQPAKDWRPIRLADIGFGQGIAVTPLHMACLYGAIANGGVLVQPRIVREVRRPDGTVCQPFKPHPLRRVISKRAASELTKMMVSCVEEGTGKTARIDGRTVAGKTGSAQMPRVNGRGYEPGAFVASFIGYAPAYKPRLVIAVVVQRPKGSHWGATVAAPVFREIGEKALWYLRVPSDKPIEAEPKPKSKQEGDTKQMARRMSVTG